MQEGEVAAAIASSEAVLSLVAAGTRESDYALLNLATIHLHAGNDKASRTVADQLRTTTSSEDLRLIAEATIAIIDAATDWEHSAGSIAFYCASRNDRRGLQPHFYGVTMLNLATIAIARGRSGTGGLSMRKRRSTRFEKTSSKIELSTALMAKAVGASAPRTSLSKLASEAIRSCGRS